MSQYKIPSHNMDLLIVTVSQKREIAQALENAGLPISSFDWQQHPSGYQYGSPAVDRLVFKNSPYFFQFDLDSNQELRAVFCPGDRMATQSQHTITWVRQFEAFNNWINRLTSEIAEPDPWEQIKAFAPDVEILFETGEHNTAFSFVEVQQIITALDTLQLQMESRFTLAQNQLQVLRTNIEYLKDQAKKQGRINWKQILIGTLVTLAVKLALPPEIRPIFWNLAQESFRAFVKLLPVLQ